MKVAIAGGGTGGHLFPGIAIAETLIERIPNVTILFISTKREFDSNHLSRLNLHFYPMPSPFFSLTPSFFVKFLSAFISSLNLLAKYKPNILIGLGGYGSVPPILAAKVLNIPFIILEQNYIPGKASKFLARWAERIYCQWEGSKKFLVGTYQKSIHSGSPLRNSLKHLDKYYARHKLGVSPDKITVAIIGGSQGASTLNRFMILEADYLGQFRDKIQIVHLTGKEYEDKVREVYKLNSIESCVMRFTNEMELIYSSADLAISRAGGIAIAELAYYGIPPILIPYPFAADDHQLANAHELEKRGAAIVIEEKNLSKGILSKIIVDFPFNNIKSTQMKDAIHSFASPNAKDIIVSDIVQLAGK